MLLIYVQLDGQEPEELIGDIVYDYRCSMLRLYTIQEKAMQ